MKSRKSLIVVLTLLGAILPVLGTTLLKNWAAPLFIGGLILIICAFTLAIKNFAK
ncbi:hypothetical protein [Latilactobacillus fuchuensis]|uniref:Uncharacterized protein n=1 Tax=Latilactobacillus fuchuensis TaxID=164393 RepID=A0A2N9DW05_9LACO|nr:hypothetical protein [Latilactobacillus fuchuensis]SPC38717.1 hypothetical protein LFUMFP_260005 [Latilactobacillus fuchuensis]